MENVCSAQHPLGKTWENFGPCCPHSRLSSEGAAPGGGVHQGEAGLPGLLGHLPRGMVGGDRHQPSVRFSHTHTPAHTHTHTHTHTDLCLLGIILSGNLLAKHLAINTQPRVDGGSQTVKVSTPGSCRPVLRCLGGEANQLSPRGCPCSLFRQLSLSLWWGRGPHPWGSLSPWETLPWLFGTGPSGCPEGTVHTPGRLWSTCSRASAAPSGGGSPRSRDSSPTQPGRHP